METLIPQSAGLAAQRTYINKFSSFETVLRLFLRCLVSYKIILNRGVANAKGLGLQIPCESVVNTSDQFVVPAVRMAQLACASFPHKDVGYNR